MQDQLELLATLPGVSGLIFHRGLEIVSNRLPAAWGLASAQLLTHAVIDGFSGYARSGRQATQCWFEFPEGNVLALTPPLQEDQITRSIARGPDQPQHLAAPFLTFLVKNRTAVPSLLAPANAFLTRQATLQLDLWIKYRKALLELLAPAADRATSKQLLDDVLATEHLSLHASVAPTDFHLLGETLIRRLPDTAAQPQLLQELSALLERIPPAR